MAIALCKNCKETFKVSRCSKNIYCSLLCYWSDMKGRPHGHGTNTTAWNKGMKLPQLSGENHPRWIRDRMLLKDDRRDRGGQLSRDWGKRVKDRDGWKCKISNQDCEGRMEAHHILGWTEYPELRYEINNGITLCHAHHPRKRAEEKLLAPVFQGLVGVSIV